mmetsp:Transcript_8592/g.13302  ORF Transcript_8592/g.13302 Transcript_8592/m.13302 type:complete len:171 (+) Transcript_8592:1955-2467(+)
MQIESILEDDLAKIIIKMDKNGDGLIQYSEFIDTAHKISIMISELYLRHAFDLFDLTDDIENAGNIPIDQLRSVMCGAIGNLKKIDIEKWEEFIEEFDENKDRQIDYHEFKKMMMVFHEQFGGDGGEEPERKSPGFRAKTLSKVIVEESSDATSNEGPFKRTIDRLKRDS